ncbi:MAG TPA: LamG-like jellyroll fold domain-containing protein, partial [Puia sp.]|nr:LamG-like jellyroll fold domain-containing protein [Puia sp.]
YANSAFNATGNGERLIVSNNGAYKVDTAFSVSCDFMIRSNAYYSGGYDFSGLQVFLSIVNVTTGTGPTFDLGLTRPEAPQYFTFGVNGAQGADCSGYGNNNPSNISDSTHFIPQLQSWYNVVCTFRKNTTSVYVNGVLVSTLTNPNTLSAVFCPDANFIVGGWWNGGNSGDENIRGKLDEVRFYNRVLNAKEIAYLARNFQVTSNKASPGLKTR